MEALDDPKVMETEHGDSRVSFFAALLSVPLVIVFNHKLSVRNID